jgi:hypothetical protein
MSNNDDFVDTTVEAALKEGLIDPKQRTYWEISLVYHPRKTLDRLEAKRRERRAPVRAVDRRLGQGAPEGTLRPGVVLSDIPRPTVGRSDGWGRKLVPHPFGGYVVAGKTSANAGTAEIEEEGLPAEWFPRAGYGRVYAG